MSAVDEIDALLAAGDWKLEGACAGLEPALADRLFYGGGGNTAAAQRICAGCPIRNRCLETALRSREEFGIWGGLTPEHRWKLMGLGAA